MSARRVLPFKRKRGPASRPYQLRLHDDQREAWEFRARLQGRTLANWIKRVCDEAAKPRA